MINEVLKNIQKNNMISYGDKVIVAVSGGPDSMCLLSLLVSLKDKYNLKLYAAHLNHLIRGEEAYDDENYVKDFCLKNNIEFYVKRVKIIEMAKMKGVSEETCGREERYLFFNELKDKLKADKIALAHNANDSAETLLMRIMRGTSVEGLVGIKPVRDNIYIRPLITITRDEIEKYCEEKDLKPHIDKTNLINIYTRNKIRLDLIPYMKDNFNQNIVKALNRLSLSASIDSDYFSIETCEKYKLYCDKKEEKVIIYNIAFKEHKALITRLIKRAIEDLKGDALNIEMIHIQSIINLQKGKTGNRVSIPGGIIAVNEYGNIKIEKEVHKEKNNEEFLLELGHNYIKEMGLNITLSLIKAEKGKIYKGNSNLRYFDFDNFTGNISVRYRKDGDRFIPFGMNQNKKLKDFFMDIKVLKEDRDKTPLILFNNEIAWVFPFRTSQKFLINIKTKNILQINVESEEQ